MRAAEQGARVVVFPEMMLTGYPVEDLALRRSFVDASIHALEALSTALAREGLDGVAVVVGYLDRRADQQPRVGVPGRLTAGRGRGAARRQRRDHVGQAPPAQLRRLRRVPLLRARRHAAGVPAAGPGRRAGRHRGRDLRGLVAGRRPGRGHPDGRRRACWWCRTPRRTSGTRTTPAGAVPAAGGRGRRRRSRTRTWSAARTSWSSTATRSSSSPAGDLLARGPQFDEALVIADLDLPAADTALPAGRQRANAGDGTHDDDRADRAGAAARAGAGRAAGRADDLAAAVRPGRDLRGAGAGRAGLRAQERVPLDHPGPVRRHRLGAHRDDRGGRARAGPGARRAQPQPVLLRALGGRRRGSGAAAGPRTPG